MVNGKIMNKKAKDLILKISKFFIYSILIYISLCHFETYLTSIIAYQSYLFLKFLLKDVILFTHIIYLPNIAISIIEPCTGILLISILLAYISTVENKLKHQVFGSVFCTLLIYFGNIIRIVIIGVLANTFENGEYIHNVISFVFGPSITVFTILLWSKLRKRL
ncbi:conserved hypothetical protein [Methanococcus maripaludis C5]|uniref:Archaeosortase family protein ArtE n=2 Tax=Methanococcus maripaludis TaxID=39152 RepID=A4FX45_METM5|nr:conserved hypothetical protein [Methanococcus maripaludis C5]